MTARRIALAGLALLPSTVWVCGGVDLGSGSGVDQYVLGWAAGD